MNPKKIKSGITHWWVADSEAKLAFANILSEKKLNQNTLVIGYLDRDRDEFTTSNNYVVKVTKKGVITENGSFFPFEEAHELYLEFLIEANKDNTVIATNWAYANEMHDSRITADIIGNDGVKNNVTFDFTPNENQKVMLAGYSRELSSNVVITTFNKKNATLKNVTRTMASEIYNSSIAFKEETNEKVKEVQRIFKKRFRREKFIN